MSEQVIATISQTPINFPRLLEISKALKVTHAYPHFHVSFILRGKRILAIGVNNERKTNPRNLKLKYVDRNKADISAYVGTHSEHRAILRLNQLDCSKYRLVNIRIDNNGNVANSKPCAGCQTLLKIVKFKEVWFTTDCGNVERF